MSRTIKLSINVYPAKKIIQTGFDEELKEWFKNTFKFSNNNIDKLMKHQCLKKDNFIGA